MPACAVRVDSDADDSTPLPSPTVAPAANKPFVSNSELLIEPSYAPFDYIDGGYSIPDPTLWGVGSFTLAGKVVTHPIYVGANSSRLNSAIRHAFRNFARESASDDDMVSYEIAYCENGLVSIWMLLLSLEHADDAAPTDPADPAAGYFELDYAEKARKPFNYDIYKGAEVSLYDCLGGEYSALTGGMLSELVSAQAVLQGYTLIAFLGPMAADQMFVFSNGEAESESGAYESGFGISFYFRQYELALPSEGCPEVFVSAELLLPFCSDSGAIMRLTKDFYTND